MTREETIAKFISTPAGRARLAQSMVQPIRGIPWAVCPFCGDKWSGGPHPDNGCAMRDIWDVSES